MENFRIEKKYRIAYVNETKKYTTGPKNKENSSAKKVEKVTDLIWLYYFDEDCINLKKKCFIKKYVWDEELCKSTRINRK